MASSVINTKFWSGGDNETTVTLKNRDTGEPIGDLTGATITARIMGPDGEIVGAVAQPSTNAGTDLANSVIGILFPVANSTWSASEVGQGNYLQIKVDLAGKIKFYETRAYIELETGF